MHLFLNSKLIWKWGDSEGYSNWKSLLKKWGSSGPHFSYFKHGMLAYFFFLPSPASWVSLKISWVGAGRALQQCSASSPSHTCCCNGARPWCSGGWAEWSCKWCRSKAVCAQSHKPGNRPASPSGLLCSWNDVPSPKIPRSSACCSTWCHPQTCRSTRCTPASSPRSCSCRWCDGTGPSGGWSFWRCNNPASPTSGPLPHELCTAGQGGKPSTDPGEHKNNQPFTSNTGSACQTNSLTTVIHNKLEEGSRTIYCNSKTAQNFQKTLHPRVSFSLSHSKIALLRETRREKLQGCKLDRRKT